ncbi:MAG: TnpV protein [Eubacteriales bacterium]|nr:TnpV protein [Eubacteriales bacterium]
MSDPLGLNYKERNGLIYPELQISNDPISDIEPLGKYGQMCLSFLKEEYPDRYAELTMNGELMPLMHKVNEQAHAQVEELTDKLIRQQGYSDTSDTMLMFRRRNAFKAVAEEVVIREFVLVTR